MLDLLVSLTVNIHRKYTIKCRKNILQRSTDPKDILSYLLRITVSSTLGRQLPANYWHHYTKDINYGFRVHAN